MQTEFSDIAPSDASSLLSQRKSGHLSLDYTCMKWVQLEKKVYFLLVITKKKKALKLWIYWYIWRLLVILRVLMSLWFLPCKRKKKPGNSILVLGTGNGDVLALDVSAGQLRWKVSDCHPGWGLHPKYYTRLTWNMLVFLCKLVWFVEGKIYVTEPRLMALYKFTYSSSSKNSTFFIVLSFITWSV